MVIVTSFRRPRARAFQVYVTMITMLQYTYTRTAAARYTHGIPGIRVTGSAAAVAVVVVVGGGSGRTDPRDDVRGRALIYIILHCADGATATATATTRSTEYYCVHCACARRAFYGPYVTMSASGRLG